jgi:predicted nucleic-acid-binding protein
MVAVDTNVLVRLVTRDDPRQVAAAEAFVAAGAWVSLLVLMEASWVLSTVYALAPREIATAVEMLLDHEHVTLDAPDVVAAALVHYRKRPGVGFSDCLILEAARRATHLPLGTFDRGLAKLPGTRRL